MPAHIPARVTIRIAGVMVAGMVDARDLITADLTLTLEAQPP
jgi:hypothetical protein